MKEKIDSFIDYLDEFYSEGGLYPMGLTRDESLVATGVRIGVCRWNSVPFEGDTIDREAVRDIVLEYRGVA